MWSLYQLEQKKDAGNNPNIKISPSQSTTSVSPNVIRTDQKKKKPPKGTKKKATKSRQRPQMRGSSEDSNSDNASEPDPPKAPAAPAKPRAKMIDWAAKCLALANESRLKNNLI